MNLMNKSNRNTSRFVRAGSAEDCGHEVEGKDDAGKFTKKNKCAKKKGGGAEAPEGEGGSIVESTQSAAAPEKKVAAKKKKAGGPRIEGDIESMIPEEYRGMLTKEELNQLRIGGKLKDTLKLLNDAVNNNLGYLPTLEEIKVLAKMGESARGQYEYGGRYLRACFADYGEAGEVVARFWETANAFFSARTGWKVHSAAASALTEVWINNGMPSGNSPEAKKKIKEIIEYMKAYEKPNGAIAFPMGNVKWKKAERLMREAPSVTEKMKELIANTKAGKTVNFGEAWTDPKAVPVDSWMGALTRPTDVFTKRSKHQLEELMDMTSDNPHLKGAAKALDKKLRTARTEVMSDPVKYNSYKMLVGRAAKELGWEPREVQETVWAAAMGIGLLRASGLKQEDVVKKFTHEMARHSWDMEEMLNDKRFTSELQRDGASEAALEDLSEWAKRITGPRRSASGKVRLSPEEERVAIGAAGRIPAAVKATVIGRTAYEPDEETGGVRVRKHWEEEAKKPPTPEMIEKNRIRRAKDKAKRDARSAEKKRLKEEAKRQAQAARMRHHRSPRRDELASAVVRLRDSLRTISRLISQGREPRTKPSRFSASDCGHDPDGDFSLENTCASLHGSIRQREKNPGYFNMSSRFKSKLRNRLGELQLAEQEGESTPEMDRERREVEDTLGALERSGKKDYDKEYRNMKKADFVKDAFHRVTSLYRMKSAGEDPRRLKAAAIVLKNAHDKLRHGHDARGELAQAVGMLKLAARNSRGWKGQEEARAAHVAVDEAIRLRRAPGIGHSPPPGLTIRRPARGGVSRFAGYYREGGVDVPAVDDTLTRAQIGLILADQYYNKRASVKPDYMINKWVVSNKFKLMEIPLWAIRPYKWVSRSDPTYSKGPLIIDGNKKGLRRNLGAFGSSIDFMVIDGKHRYYRDIRRSGADTIVSAYVGDAIYQAIQEYIEWYAPLRHAFIHAVHDYYRNPNPATQAALLKAGDDARMLESQTYSLIDKFRRGYIFNFDFGEFVETGKVAMLTA